MNLGPKSITYGGNENSNSFYLALISWQALQDKKNSGLMLISNNIIHFSTTNSTFFLISSL